MWTRGMKSVELNRQKKVWIEISFTKRAEFITHLQINQNTWHQMEFLIIIFTLQRATATHTWARSGRGEMNSAAGSSLSPTSSWTPCRTQTTARRQTPSAWTARTAWRPASPPAPRTTSPGQAVQRVPSRFKTRRKCPEPNERAVLLGKGSLNK